MKKAALHNLGCKVNAYETEAMQQILEDAGYEMVPFSEYADVYVINTCSVTNMADRKSRQMIHRAKKMNPEAVVVAAGCYVQAKEESGEIDSCIDIVIGNNRKKDFCLLLSQFLVANLIDNNETWNPHCSEQLFSFLSLNSCVDFGNQVTHCDVVGFATFMNGKFSQGNCKMTFACSRVTNEDDVLAFVHETQSGKASDLSFID